MATAATLEVCHVTRSHNAAAYRRVYGEPAVSPHWGCADEAIKAATAAVKDMLPDMSDCEVMLEAVAAVHYASWAHPEWLYALYKVGAAKRLTQI